MEDTKETTVTEEVAEETTDETVETNKKLKKEPKNKYKEEDKRHCGIPSRQPPSNPPEIYTLKKITPDCTRVGLCD